MVKVLIFFLPLLLWADLTCNIEQQKIYCTYFIDRSDNQNGKKVEFHWYSPNAQDDRIKVFEVPPLYGSIYDYRFLPGRVAGKWRVVARELDTNKSAEATFELNESEDFFED